MKGRAVVAIVVASILLLAVAGCDQINEWFNETPTAKISVNTLPLKMGEEREFRSESTDTDGTIVGWKWDFGDGATSIEENPVHAFSKTGTLYIKLTVTDDDGGTDSETQSIEVTSPGPKLRGEINVRGTSCSSCGSPYDTGEELTFSADVYHPIDGKSIFYSWDLGDEEGKSNDEIVRYIYPLPGHYTVELTLTDEDNVSNVYTTEITVEERCRPCLPEIRIDVAGDLRVGEPITLTGEFGHGYHVGCPRIAEAIAAGTEITPKHYCDHDDDPCDCPNSCNSCGCRNGRWDWRINFYPDCGGVKELRLHDKSVTICANQPGVFKITCWYTCAGNTNDADRTIEVCE